MSHRGRGIGAGQSAGQTPVKIKDPDLGITKSKLRVHDQERDGIILHLFQNVLEVRSGSVGLVRGMLPWSRPEMMLAWIRLWNLRLLPSLGDLPTTSLIKPLEG